MSFALILARATVEKRGKKRKKRKRRKKSKNVDFVLESCVFWVFGMIYRVFHKD